jgi:Spx/MgsR family transcriptional regulator
MISVYGLKNCDTCRKALKWLEAEGVAHAFYDLRKDGATRDQIAHWVKKVGTEQLINRRGTTWRSLSEADKNSVDEVRAIDLIVEHPALIKRPLIEYADGGVSVGFSEAVKQGLAE